MTDLVLRNCLVVDGTGSRAFRGDIAIGEGEIEAIGDLRGIEAENERQLDGLVVAPGFIDIHSHSDLSILGHPLGTSKVLQGVTTEVVGNCGLSVAPIASLEVAAMLRPLMSYCDDPRVTWDWTSVAEYLQRVDAAAPHVGILILAGHNTIRGSVVGLDERPATATEIAKMQDMLDRALDDGAVGLSLGLMYPPSSYADETELIALGRTLAARDGILASHMADYGSGLLESVSAMIRIAEASGCRLQISHLAVTGRENWGLVAPALEVVDAANRRGVDVGVDFYPYLAGSTNLSQLVPLWSLAGGLLRFRERLADPTHRAAVLEHLSRRSLGWDEVVLVSVPALPALDGLRVSEAAERRGTAAEELVIELLELCDPTIVAFGRSEDDLRTVLTHPSSVLGSDGLAVETTGTVGGPVPHPRFFGAFPALFEHYVRESGVLSLEEAVRKCTSAPAARVRLDDRGVIAVGKRADLVIFDPDEIADGSSYVDSRKTPRGIVSVFRAGREIARDGKVLVTPQG